jgi:adenylosuccinate lyase
MTSPYDTFVSPLAERNASPEMLRVWSPRHKFETWRRVWLIVAEKQHELGLPITKEQLDELRANLDVTDADLHRAEHHERSLRHDVMSHVHAWGDRCPKARGIIHLGLTSQDVVCNADLLIIQRAMALVAGKCVRLIRTLADFAQRWKALPTLGFTHYQPAQPTTVGRRAAQWAYDLALCLDRVHGHTWETRLRGLRGATGTQASFLHLFANDHARVDELEDRFIGAFGTLQSDAFTLTAQTYPRVHDCFVLADLAAVAAVLHKVAGDIRLLANRKELDEPFGEKQIGSSAMPYKRNPMRCERVCGLSRLVFNFAANAYDTAAVQWLERTLDDSSNRRVALPEAFLALDGALDLMQSVVSGLEVHEATIRANLMLELPFMAVENILMAAARHGADRQHAHEVLRRHAQAAGARVKGEGLPNDLLDRLKAEPLLTGIDIDAEADPARFIGRAVEQVDHFLVHVVGNLGESFPGIADVPGSAEPRV